MKGLFGLKHRKDSDTESRLHTDRWENLHVLVVSAFLPLDKLPWHSLLPFAR